MAAVAASSRWSMLCVCLEQPFPLICCQQLLRAELATAQRVLCRLLANGWCCLVCWVQHALERARRLLLC